MSTKFEIHQLKAEANFVADDPWNANRRDTFALDYYVYLPDSWMAAADAVWVDEVRGYAMPLLLAIPFAAVFPVIIGWMVYRAVYQVWQRRMAQTKWTLSRARA
jgi:hypothetical protein